MALNIINDPNFLHDPSLMTKIDLPAFMERNSKDARSPEIFAFAKYMRSKYSRVGAIGFCFGGWGVFQLGAVGNSLVDCISTAHPSFLTMTEIDDVDVPVQILAPEIDPMFTTELKAHSNETIPKRGLPYDYQYFPGLEHAFATRGNPNNRAERRGMVRAKNAAVCWFREWLHDNQGLPD